MKKNLIIHSIGSANPNIAKVIADTFDINHKLFTIQLYNAPMLFLENAEEEIADKAAFLLTQLGLEVVVQDEGKPLLSKSEPVDIAVHIANPLCLTKVSRQLAKFISCKENEALSLLLKEPSVVLGNVSIATAKVLQKRLDAEVIASTPKNDLYTIELLGDDSFRKEIFISLINKDKYIKNNKWITDLPYTNAIEIWNRYHQSQKLNLYNQSFQRFEILLENFDINNESQTDFLVNRVGMPKETLPTILENLPVIIEESLNRSDSTVKMDEFSKAGLGCSKNAIPFGKYKIEVNNIKDSKKFVEIVSQFYSDLKYEKDSDSWIAPKPIDGILNRYLEKQLEYLGCDVNHQYETV